MSLRFFRCLLIRFAGSLLFASFGELSELFEDCMLDMLLDVRLLVLNLREFIGVREEVVHLSVTGLVSSDC